MLRVDKLAPVPIFNSLLPTMSWVPGDAITVTFSEELDCRRPLSVGFIGSHRNGSSNFTLQPTDIYPLCQGNTITLSWNTLQRPAVLASNRNVTLQLFGAVDMAGNVQARVLNMSFTIASVPSTVRR
jgi:hypothetical protein